MSHHQLYLQKTAQQLDLEAFDRGVGALVSARQIFLYGKNASAPLAAMLAFRLRRLGLPVSLLPSSGSELLEGLLQAGTGDLVVMFSFSKLSREGRVILEHRRAAGYQTLAFVSRTCIPPEEQADISLFAYRGEEMEYHSMSAPTALLDALVLAAASRLGPRGADALERLHQLKTTYFPRTGQSKGLAARKTDLRRTGPVFTSPPGRAILSLIPRKAAGIISPAKNTVTCFDRRAYGAHTRFQSKAWVYLRYGRRDLSRQPDPARCP